MLLNKKASQLADGILVFWFVAMVVTAIGLFVDSLSAIYG